MATHNLGKLKIKTSGDGIAFRFGEGKIYRLPFGRKAGNKGADYPDYDDDYMNDADYENGEYGSEDDYAPRGYSGRYQSEPADDDYADDDYYEDERYDNRYDERYDDRYEDDYADDGYADDDGYYDDGYGDDGEYDDRYLDEDAGEYDDGAYGSDNPLMRYIDENDWVTYLLLVVLPPLGIYLLWRRNRFDRTIRSVVSGVSALWFIIAVILIISLISSGSGDVTKNPPITMNTAAPTELLEASPEVSAAPVSDALSNDVSGTGATENPIVGGTVAPDQTQDLLAIDATATPIASVGGTTNSSVTGNTVIMTATGLYYHNNSACSNIEAGAATSNVARDIAEQRGKVACPICYPNQETFYATSGGKYYHSSATCSDMEDAAQITKAAAEQQGKTACPVCILKTVNSLKDGELKFADASTTDRSGITVYATSGGRYFHLNSTCSGMENATSGSLLSAMLSGKKACPTCASGADTKVWCTEGGTYYHNKSDCSGMENGYQVTLAEAKILGKKKCSSCWGNSTVGDIGSGSSSGSSASGSSSDGTVYVYGTSGGKYYHTNASCSGMTGASRYTLKSMIASGREACPTCCGEASSVVYATENGTYYHSYASCSGMENAQAGTLAQALAYGKTRCPKCWSGSSSSSGSDAVLGQTASGSYVYCTEKGTYYHTKSSCSGMSGASKVPLSTAVNAGKKACPTCASAANYNVYSTKTGTYYHRTSSCSGMSGASQRTIQEAVMLGQSACPVCIVSKLNSSSSSSGSSSGSSSSNGSVSNVTSEKIHSSNTYKSGTSGIKVYATSTSKHYHTVSTCSGMTNATRVTLETALNYGKTACSKCASSASTKVYAVKNGKYYHYSKSCAGDGAVSGTRASALAVGLDACPYCVTKTKTEQVSSDTYKSGTSGIKVYASVNGKYYHSSQSCAGAGSSKISLETALNYGKTACPSCASSAKKTVYSSSGDKYYHTSKTCAGDDAVSGQFAKALALGKKECPICIGGSEAYEVSDVKYSAPGDTNVYIDLDSDMLYYHKNAKCSDAGLSGGTKVMLDFVLSWGYKACPFCAPPTSAE